MSQINAQIYSGMWIRIRPDVKSFIAGAFSIPKNGATHVVNNEVVADGYMDIDLARLNLDSINLFLKSNHTDLFVAWNHLLTQVEESIDKANNPPKEAEKAPVAEINIKIEGNEVKVEQAKPRGRPKKNV